MVRATTLIAVLAIAAPSFADDLSPPPWRFNPGTTVQHWDFTGGPGGGAPDALPLNNPYGAGPLFSPLAPALWLPAFNGRTEVWDLTSTGVAAGLDFFVPNTGNGINQKNLWLQITYWSPAPSGPPNVQITSGSGLFTQLSSTITTLPGGWVHELSLWNVPTCPQKEVVHIFPSGAPLFIDQVVIDTQCIPIPAPAAAAPLALAGLLAARRRRS